MNKFLLLLLVGLTFQLTVNSQVITSINKIVGKTGASKNITGEILNNGSETVTSLSLTASDGNKSWTENFTGLNIAPKTTASFEMTQAVELIKGEKNITVALSKVNGNVINPNNTNITARGLDLIRSVVVEEATGTWCGWCVRGHVFMNKLSEEYPGYFVGIAVHNNDPMVVDAYDSGFKAASFPTAKVARDTFLNPSDIEIPFLDAAAKPADVALTASATYDKDTKALIFKATTTPTKNMVAAKFFIALVEDGVTGSGSGWDQANYYTNNQNGPMGGYENKPNPVPAANMVYNHVARALFGSVNGISGSIKSPWLKGKEISYVYDNYTIPSDFNIANLRAVVGVLDNNNRFANVVEIPVQEALSSSEVFNHNLVTISPNPFSETSYANIELTEAKSVSMKIMNSLGQVVVAKNYGQLNGKQSLPIYGNDLQKGLYFINMQIGDQTATKEVILIK
ncbi:MAG TPA: Omp28-related outer membrane protein [Saprospiraceae bacterium]|nr:Omp28-related outer membrane protein [Saprospiraceae bacterium]